MGSAMVVFFFKMALHASVVSHSSSAARGSVSLVSSHAACGSVSLVSSHASFTERKHNWNNVHVCSCSPSTKTQVVCHVPPVLTPVGQMTGSHSHLPLSWLEASCSQFTNNDITRNPAHSTTKQGSRYGPLVCSQNQALGVCRGFVPDIQVCGTHGREDLVIAIIKCRRRSDNDTRFSDCSCCSFERQSILCLLFPVTPPWTQGQLTETCVHHNTSSWLEAVLRDESSHFSHRLKASSTSLAGSCPA